MVDEKRFRTFEDERCPDWSSPRAEAEQAEVLALSASL